MPLREYPQNQDVAEDSKSGKDAICNNNPKCWILFVFILHASYCDTNNSLASKDEFDWEFKATPSLASSSQFHKVRYNATYRSWVGMFSD